MNQRLLFNYFPKSYISFLQVLPKDATSSHQYADMSVSAFNINYKTKKTAISSPESTNNNSASELDDFDSHHDAPHKTTNECKIIKKGKHYLSTMHAPLCLSIEQVTQEVTKETSCTGTMVQENEHKISDDDECDAASKQKKKKRKRRFVTICTSHCKHEVVRRVARRFNMREVGEQSSWNLFWTDLSISVERAKEMKRYQKINHFPGMTEICRKDLLARNLNRMLKIFPKDYNFFPQTWCLPFDHGELNAYARNKRNKTYICKPETGCQGKGIYLTKHIKDIKPYERMICQLYLPKPYLLDGLKFDLRIYVLVTSCDPLRIFIYNDGLVRLATCAYKEPTEVNSTNVYMHLTNYAVNKHSRAYKVDDEAGTKRRISSLNKHLVKQNVDVVDLWSRIDDVIIKTMIAAHPILKHSYNACFPSHDHVYACFELLGFDVILDHNLKPYLLEVNHSPSFHTDAKIDKDIKESLLNDTFKILNLGNTDKRKVMEEDRKRVRDRLLQGIYKESNVDPIELTNERFKAQARWEEENCGDFRYVFPANNQEKYEAFFHQNSSSLFQDTFASRAREECARNQREEAIAKANKEAAKRIGAKPKDLDKISPESPTAKNANTAMKPKKKTLKALVKVPPDVANDRLNSFLPDTIFESDERERKTGLAQRESLLRNYGIVEQICNIMNKCGTLRDPDKKKYASQNREVNLTDSLTTVIPTKLPSIVQNGPSGDKVQQPNTVMIGADLDLNVTCNNVPISLRPIIPQYVWIEDQKRVTKTHAIRLLTNTVRLKGLEKRVIRPNLQNS